MTAPSGTNPGSDWSLTSDLEFVTDAVGSEVWADLKNASIFMTGGTGFIGCWLLEALRHADIRLGLDLNVTVLTRNPAAFQRKAPHLAGYERFHFVSGDVSDFDSPQG
jgi:dTDP-glucose 4,6-dehydratase